MFVISKEPKAQPFLAKTSVRQMLKLTFRLICWTLESLRAKRAIDLDDANDHRTNSVRSPLMLREELEGTPDQFTPCQEGEPMPKRF